MDKKAEGRNLITEDQFNHLFSKLELVHVKLNGYMKFIGKKSVTETQTN
jgi:hypothetical protein